jgi:cbb3-type cytochrome oxidase maturation protein
MLIPISLVIIALAIGVFFWAVKSGQYDDLEGPAYRILYDEDEVIPDDETAEGEGQAKGTGGPPSETGP